MAAALMWKPFGNDSQVPPIHASLFTVHVLEAIQMDAELSSEESFLDEDDNELLGKKSGCGK